jgi:hypothetical protein
VLLDRLKAFSPPRREGRQDFAYFPLRSWRLRGKVGTALINNTQEGDHKQANSRKLATFAKDIICQIERDGL